MAAVIALLVLAFAAHLVVMAGAVAYEVTGIEKSMARFQALSAFTGCGFTTSHAERLVAHPARRSVTASLITAGYVGTASVVATLIQSVDVSSIGQSLHRAAVALLGFAALLWWSRHKRDTAVAWLRRWMGEYLEVDPPEGNKSWGFADGFEFAVLTVSPGHPAAGGRLADLKLGSWRVAALALHAPGYHEMVPTPDAPLPPGVRVTLFGQVDVLARLLAAARAEAPESRTERGEGDRVP